ncbi:unnamed protein product [Trifolium pratense]|uniref:Uncharacterized protein n=1 Tax=Trifolium pratense TaxID=57577 RepID=A0ACB0LY18_TRIPR|nr:unnamed protein product [Trifolium pratense]
MTPFLTSLFHRFTNLTSLNLTHFQGDLDALLSQIPPLKYLTSLNLSHQPSLPAYGLQAFSKQITTLTSLIATNLYSSFSHTDLFLIADSFPLLEELNLYYAKTIDNKNTGYIDGIEALSLALIKLHIPSRRIVLTNTVGYSYGGLFSLLSKYCRSIQHLDLNCYKLLNDHRVVELSELLVGLVSLNLTNSDMLTYSSLFALLSKSLRKITAAPPFHFTETQRKLFLLQGCILC